MRSPTLLLRRMNAAETSASSAMAPCTPLTVAPMSWTTAEIDTFMSDVSTTSTNIAIASRSDRRELPAPSRGAAMPASAVTNPLANVPAAHARTQGCWHVGTGRAGPPRRRERRSLSRMSLQAQVLKVHERIYKSTDGRVGHKMIGVPTLLLSTTGRRSGQTRTNALVYAKDGDDYLVVASNGGADKPPGWLFNIEAKPEVEIQVGRDKQAATARALRPGEPDYERLWKIVNDNNK